MPLFISAVARPNPREESSSDLRKNWGEGGRFLDYKSQIPPDSLANTFQEEERYK